MYIYFLESDFTEIVKKKLTIIYCFEEVVYKDLGNN